MAKIVKRERLVPNIHLLEVSAPEVADKCRPGQFVMVMPDKRGERIPLTIADWDRKKGTVTSVFMVVGTSTHRLTNLNAGDDLPVYVGPLGKVTEIKKYGNVLCAGGCYGIGAVYPVARALKEAGNRIFTLLDVKADYLLYWEDRFRDISEKFFVSSRDGYYDCKDYIPKVLENVLEEYEVDRIISIGCTYLMYTCAQTSKPHNIDTIVSLNPIMVDGTGMCGACRVSVGGKNVFACVDGPEFDGHKVDWDELFSRRKSYFDDEIRSLCHWEEKQYP